MSEGAGGEVHKKGEGNHGKDTLTQTAAVTASDKKKKTSNL